MRPCERVRPHEGALAIYSCYVRRFRSNAFHEESCHELISTRIAPRHYSSGSESGAWISPPFNHASNIATFIAIGSTLVVIGPSNVHSNIFSLNFHVLMKQLQTNANNRNWVAGCWPTVCSHPCLYRLTSDTCHWKGLGTTPQVWTHAISFYDIAGGGWTDLGQCMAHSTCWYRSF